MTMNNNKENGIILSWNALRLIFILCIVYFHTHSGAFWSDKLKFITEYGGYLGNYFFFFISGVLISRKWKNKIADENVSPWKFLFSRIKRFYPLYIFSELVIISWMIINSGIGSISITQVLTDIFLVTNGWIMTYNITPYNMPAWFLCVLVLCYVFYYVICRLSRKSNTLYLLLIAFMCLLGLFLRRANLAIPFMYRTTGEGYACFFAGTVFYRFWEVYVKDHEKAFCFVSLGVLAAIIAGTVLLSPKVFWADEAVIVILISASCLYLTKTKKIQPFFENKAVSFISNLSMEIFLMHIPLWVIYRDVIRINGLVLNENVIYYIAYLLLLLVISALIHLVREIIKEKAQRKESRQA